ncbi:MAG TPA: nuclear transport factor 2 family protein [Chthoniobacterales bacterium]|nr:nuclear transport factor 2 family protein [Chthoniobacterales bacterium]
MTKAVTILAFLTAVAGIGLAQDPKRDVASEIQKVIQTQQAGWNRGDIEGFMDGYWRSEKTVFVSGDELTRGWQKVLDRYKARYSDRAKMGTLTFSEIEITPLSGDSAIALGSWKLNREHDPASPGSVATSSPHGRFTLIFRHFPDGWKIIHDHTSAAE